MGFLVSSAVSERSRHDKVHIGVGVGRRLCFGGKAGFELDHVEFDRVGRMSDDLLKTNDWIVLDDFDLAVDMLDVVVEV
jgi:hypothetical protein